MIRAFVTWLRLVWPPGWIVTLVVGFCLVFAGLDHWVTSHIGPWDAVSPLAMQRHAVVLIASAIYGIYRVYFFHPFWRPAYASWLALVPWTSAKPLPNGPVHLVWQDGAAMILLEALAYYKGSNPWTIPLAAIVLYLVTLGMTFWPIGLKWATYVAAFGLGLVIRLQHYPWAIACVLVLLYGFLWFALRRALDQFPWERPPWLEKLLSAGKSVRGSNNQLGWPFDALCPEPKAIGISLIDATLLSLLLAWFTYALLSIVPGQVEAQRDAIATFTVFFSFLTMICVVGRLVNYCAYHWPPIGFWGRIFTLRWIIPGYDQVFVAPLCTLLLAITTPMALRMMGLPVNIALPCAAFAVLFVTLAVGPTRREWFLTGNHRIGVSGLTKNRQEFLEL